MKKGRRGRRWGGWWEAVLGPRLECTLVTLIFVSFRARKMFFT